VNNLNKQPIGQTTMYIIEHIELKPVTYARDINLNKIETNIQIKQTLSSIQLPANGLRLEPLEYNDSGMVIIA
jgi:hypothetical protein